VVCGIKTEKLELWGLLNPGNWFRPTPEPASWLRFDGERLMESAAGTGAETWRAVVEPGALHA
jgi:hypothetical protein